MTAVGLAAFLASWTVPGTAKGEPAVIDQGGSFAVVQLSEPKGFAVVRHAGNGRRSLYGPGDAISHPSDPLRMLLVERIEDTELVVRESPSGRRWVLQPGHPLPGFPGLMFTTTAVVQELRYEFTTDREMPGEAPRLVSLAGSKAVLQKGVPQAPSSGLRPRSPGTRATKTHFDPAAKQIDENPVRQLDEHTYELEKDFVMAALDPMAELLTKLTPVLTPALSATIGPLTLSTKVGDGVLDQAGLTITSLKVAQTLGFEVGDTVVSINGRGITSALTAWWTLQEEIIRNPNRKPLRVKIVREGKLITKTYKIL